MKDFSAIYGLSEELDRVQQNVEEVLRPIARSELLDGNLITADITTAGTEIRHRLGRPYKGLIVVKKTGFSGSITEEVPSDSSIYIKLDTTVNTTVSVWVF